MKNTILSKSIDNLSIKDFFDNSREIDIYLLTQKLLNETDKDKINVYKALYNFVLDQRQYEVIKRNKFII
ncbi:hypothetical protein [Apilactobacillus quenuiae]|uniref:hypothetical protein n=1 Tax=Apilactobacillus quenuiae TaxID=2008377 RepID=UPI000D018D3F|nr:hypothetical protein [Apilactobacillus quenuiae]